MGIIELNKWCWKYGVIVKKLLPDFTFSFIDILQSCVAKMMECRTFKSSIRGIVTVKELIAIECCLPQVKRFTVDVTTNYYGVE